jgi:hypothetical protein
MSKLEQLKRPFDEADVEWRIQQSGVSNGKPWAMCLAYITNRGVMNRLDEVFGLSGWKNEFAPTPTMGGTMCGISFKENGDWITKWDGADDTQVEATKGGLSASMKRAVVQIGIGRYLYSLDAGWARIVEKGTTGAKSAKTKDGTWFNWLPPELPNWALPITSEQLKLINEKIEESKADTKILLEVFHVKDIFNATKEQGVQLIEALDKKLAKMKKEEEANK